MISSWKPKPISHFYLVTVVTLLLILICGEYNLKKLDRYFICDCIWQWIISSLSINEFQLTALCFPCVRFTCRNFVHFLQKNNKKEQKKLLITGLIDISYDSWFVILTLIAYRTNNICVVVYKLHIQAKWT